MTDIEMLHAMKQYIEITEAKGVGEYQRSYYRDVKDLLQDKLNELWRSDWRQNKTWEEVTEEYFAKMK